MRRSKIFDIGDIVRVPYPYVEKDRFAVRPALVISRPVGLDGSLVWTLMITSARRGPWPGDIDIGPNHGDYGLPRPCFVRTAKVAALQLEVTQRLLGRLPDDLLAAVSERVRSALT